MAEHAGKPKVRFAGFTETWEQRKLGEIAEKTFGGGPLQHPILIFGQEKSLGFSHQI